MENPFQSYFSFHLSRNFVRYEISWADAAAASAATLGDVIFQDLARKHPAKEKSLAVIAALLEEDANFEAVFLYRCLRDLFILDAGHFLLPILSRLMKLRCGAEIYYSTAIGPGFRIVHSQGLVIGARHRIGAHFTCYQGVTIGTRYRNRPETFAEIGDHCSLNSGSKVLAPVKMGNHVELGANSVLLSDALSNSTYVGAPAKRVVPSESSK